MAKPGRIQLHVTGLFPFVLPAKYLTINICNRVSPFPDLCVNLPFLTAKTSLERSKENVALGKNTPGSVLRLNNLAGNQSVIGIAMRRQQE